MSTDIYEVSSLFKDLVGTYEGDELGAIAAVFLFILINMMQGDNMDLKIMLSHKGANYLREWEEAMPIAIQNIILSTEKVISAYQFVSDNVGPHREAFYQMLLNIKKAQEDSVEALALLPIELQKTADKIDLYCDSSVDGTHIPPVKILTLHR